MIEHGFSVRLKSKESVVNISISEKGGEPVLFEGVLGDLVGIEIVEETVLHIIGTKGALMIDITEEDLSKRRIR